VDDDADGYELLDAGGGRRLERFGEVVLDRPAPGAMSPPRGDRAAWVSADARYERRPGAPEGGWVPAAAIPERWAIELDGVALELRPTPSGQVGCFPEHRGVARWAAEQAVASGRFLGRPAAVLNLFAYTGLATLVLARAGATVAHVDSARPAVTWARRNAALAGLGDRPIRWLIDDAMRFVSREVRRGRHYDGVLLDPPTYGHGPDGGAWRLEDDLGPLLAGIRALMVGPGGFVACTAHATGLGPDLLAGLLRDGLGLGGGRVETRELVLVASSGARLATGWAALAGAVAAGQPR
jgi:23S rRNA (cytosine1962-C5)-methyltransferase